MTRVKGPGCTWFFFGFLFLIFFHKEDNFCDLVCFVFPTHQVHFERDLFIKGKEQILSDKSRPLYRREKKTI